MLHALLLIGCVLAFTLADYFAAKWGYDRSPSAFWIAVLVGPLSYLLFGHLSATTSLARMGAFVNGGIVIAVSLAGVLFLGERPDRLTWIAIVVIALGLALLSLGKVERPGA